MPSDCICNSITVTNTIESATDNLENYTKAQQQAFDPRFLELYADMQDGVVDNVNLLNALTSEYGLTANEAFARAEESSVEEHAACHSLTGHTSR